MQTSLPQTMQRPDSNVSRPQLTPSQVDPPAPLPTPAEMAALLRAAQDAVEDADAARVAAERREDELMQMLIAESAKVKALQQALDRERLRCEALAWKLVCEGDSKHGSGASAAAAAASRRGSIDERR